MEHRFVTFRPMRPGVSGFARIQGDAEGAVAQVNARGLKPSGMRVFWYSGGAALELGAKAANARGEAFLSARLPRERLAPERLQALLVASGDVPPAPLMVALCVSQSAGSALDAKNALLALCARLGDEMKREREARRGDDARDKELDNACSGECGAPAVTQEPSAAAPVELPVCPTAVQAPTSELSAAACVEPIAPAPADPPQNTRPRGLRALRGLIRAKDPPREIFLTAIDPLPYVLADEAPMKNAVEPAQGGAPSRTVDTPPSGCPSVDGTGAAPHALPQDPVPSRTVDTPPSRRPAVDAAGETPHTAGSADAQENARAERRERDGIPVSDLPKLRWPQVYASLQGYFERLAPCAPLALPGWRFVRAEDALYIGRRVQDARVTDVAYALRADRPPRDGKPYQALRGRDGLIYQVLWQRC